MSAIRTRPKAAHPYRGTTPAAQARSRLSHENSALDETLLNDIPMEGIEEENQEEREGDQDSDTGDDNGDDDSFFSWDSEQSLLWALMEEGYVCLIVDRKLTYTIPSSHSVLWVSLPTLPTDILALGQPFNSSFSDR